MAHPESYTAFAFAEKFGNLQKVTRQWADPKDGQIVVKVQACGVCAGDAIPQVQAWPIPLPRVPGHEFAGEIVAVPPSETEYKLGEIVGGGWHGGHCFTCTQCRLGNFNGCEKHTIHGITEDGGYAEYITMKREGIARVPSGMDPAIAGPLLCAGTTAFNGLRHMDLTAGDLVAVHGIGGVGHLAIQFAHKMGYRVVALSSSPAKRDDCLRFGAFAYLDSSEVDQAAELQKLGGAKVIMLCAPAHDVAGLLGGLADGGTLLVLGAPHEPTAIPLASLISKRLSIRGWASGHAKDNEETLQFAHAFDVKPLVQTFPLEQAQEAYDHRSAARFRAVITIP